MKRSRIICAFRIAGLFPAAAVRGAKPGFICKIPPHNMDVLKLKPIHETI